MSKKSENTNIYRTSRYIVEQNLFLSNSANKSVLYSYDVYYLRNKHRDKKYNSMFSNRKDVDGKRVHTFMYMRKYTK